MRARMLAVLGWMARRLGDRGPAPAPIRPRKRPTRVPSRFEPLERREVLSTATFVPFATLPGQVSTPGQTAEVTLHFSAGQVTSSKSSSVLVGFYAESTSGSAATPEITEVDGLSGSLSRVSLPKRGGLSPSKSLFVTYLQTSTNSAQDVTIKVTEPNKQVGGFVLKAFLPGDANADNTVDGVDVALVQRAYGTAVGQPNNNLAADFNADGHVGCIDLRLTQMNQGAQVTYGATPAPTIPPPVPAGTILTPVRTPVPVLTALSSPSPLLKPTVVIAPAAATVPTTAPTLVPVVEYVPVLTYAYPQPVGMVPVVAPASTVQSGPTTSPVYYYGQPVVQSPAQVSAAAVPYGYAQPIAQGSAVAIPANSMPVYYLPQASASATSSSTAR